jgi:hypothetical protein
MSAADREETGMMRLISWWALRFFLNSWMMKGITITTVRNAAMIQSRE